MIRMINLITMISTENRNIFNSILGESIYECNVTIFS